ncbi:hypothetical protein FHX77_000716 [Bifidobacterium commune]|uniref:TadE-like protein n=1 Tax=Bifidobacterium commune TaxID=1505727 RepID=A0A1C4GZB2_9BIFI|nr:TadE family protein [Bifidobacterium commune]MBB2955313.1 hypothetical protein [Bifidobacterium commune]SCC77959.1 TadE-like protein [Bifidobacterium commune]
MPGQNRSSAITIHSPFMWLRACRVQYRRHHGQTVSVDCAKRTENSDCTGHASNTRDGVAFLSPRPKSCRQHGHHGGDEGAVTAEFAVVLPAVMVMAVLLMMLARTVTVEMSCQDAASAAARVAVVSGDDDEARSAAENAAGEKVDVSIKRRFKQVNVVVSCRVVPDPLHVLPMAVIGKATGVVQ